MKKKITGTLESIKNTFALFIFLRFTPGNVLCEYIFMIIIILHSA